MMRTEQIECDWCRTSAEEIDDDPVERGWISVEVYDIMTEAPKDLDFCSKECLLSFFYDEG